MRHAADGSTKNTTQHSSFLRLIVPIVIRVTSSQEREAHRTYPASDSTAVRSSSAVTVDVPRFMTTSPPA